MRSEFLRHVSEREAAALAEFRHELALLEQVNGPLDDTDPRRFGFAFSRWVEAFVGALPESEHHRVEAHVRAYGTSYPGAVIVFGRLARLLGEDERAQLHPKGAEWWEDCA